MSKDFLNVTYHNLESGKSRLLSDLIPKSEEQNYLDDTIDPYISNLAERNSGDALIVKIDLTTAYLNLIPQKQFVPDSELSIIKELAFNYFSKELELNVDKISFVLDDGEIFKTVNSNSYYIIEDGKVSTIPNTKTLEVNLFQRNKTIDDVVIIESGELDSLLLNSAIQVQIDAGISRTEAEKLILSSEETGGGGGNSFSPGSCGDKSSSWNDQMKNFTFLETFEDLAETADSAASLEAAALEQVNANLEVKKAEEEAAKVEAEARIKEAELRLAELEAEKNEET